MIPQVSLPRKYPECLERHAAPLGVISYVFLDYGFSEPEPFKVAVVQVLDSRDSATREMLLEECRKSSFRFFSREHLAGLGLLLRRTEGVNRSAEHSGLIAVYSHERGEHFCRCSLSNKGRLLVESAPREVPQELLLGTKFLFEVPMQWRE